MQQLNVDEFGNRLLYDGKTKRFILLMKNGKQPHLADKRGDVIAIKKKCGPDQFLHTTQSWGINRMLMAYGARQNMILDFQAFNGDEELIHIRMTCAEFIKGRRLFTHRGYEEQYELKNPNGAKVAEHLPKNTEDGALKFCNKCGKITRHYSAGGRIGRCMEHESQEETKKQKEAREKREHEHQNPRLFNADPQDDVQR